MVTMTTRLRTAPDLWARIGVPWLIAYGALQAYWALGHRPADLSPVGGDLVAFTGWGAVALCTAGALVLTGLMTVRAAGTARRLLLVAAWAAAAGLVASGALLLLDVIGAVLPGLGIEFFPLGALSRTGCVGGGVLVGLAALAYQRRTRAGCAECGRAATARGPLERTPAWAYAAAYASVAGCVVRVLAQVAVGFEESPLSSGASALLFEIGFLLGGSVLPLALAHSWGRVWPRWIPGLAGRNVPRRLVLWPAAGVSSALIVYFGLMLVQMVAERLRGRNPFPPSGGLELPEVFFWFAVPAYLAWGIGMAGAAAGYARVTRSGCARCGR